MSRILFVTWDGPALTYTEGLFLPIFRALQKHGYGVDILQFTWDPGAAARSARIACDQAGVGYTQSQIWRFGGPTGPFLSALRGGREIQRAARRYGSSIIMPRSLLPAISVLVGRSWRLGQVLFDADGLEADERVDFAGLSASSLTYRILRDVEAEMVRRSDAVLVRSAFAAEVLASRAGPGVDADLFHIVTNGRDATVFHPHNEQVRQQSRRKLGIGPTEPLLVYAGSVGGKYQFEKVADLARAIRRRGPDLRLLVLTGSCDEAMLLLQTSHPDILATAKIKSAAPGEVATYLAAADLGAVFITPSFSMRAAAPIKTAEYLMCGLPVVGNANVGDTTSAIEGGVFFDAARGLDAAAQWFTETVWPERERFRLDAHAIGLERFSLDAATQAYLTAIRAAEAGR